MKLRLEISIVTNWDKYREENDRSKQLILQYVPSCKPAQQFEHKSSLQINALKEKESDMKQQMERQQRVSDINCSTVSDTCLTIVGAIVRYFGKLPDTSYCSSS